eukprot:10835988-Lingulodinium_polyedra.AAC.1
MLAQLLPQVQLAWFVPGVAAERRELLGKGFLQVDCWLQRLALAPTAVNLPCPLYWHTHVLRLPCA